MLPTKFLLIRWWCIWIVNLLSYIIIILCMFCQAFSWPIYGSVNGLSLTKKIQISLFYFLEEDPNDYCIPILSKFHQTKHVTINYDFVLLIGIIMQLHLTSFPHFRVFLALKNSQTQNCIFLQNGLFFLSVWLLTTE